MDRNKRTVNPDPIKKGLRTTISREVYNFMWTEAHETDETTGPKIRDARTSADFVGERESHTEAAKWMTHIQEKLSPVTHSDNQILRKLQRLNSSRSTSLTRLASTSEADKQAKTARDKSQRVTVRSPGSVITTARLGDKSAQELTARQIAENLRSNRFSFYSKTPESEKTSDTLLTVPKSGAGSSKSMSPQDTPSRSELVFSNISKTVSRLLYQLKKHEQKRRTRTPPCSIPWINTAEKLAPSQRRNVLQSLELEMKKANSLVRAGRNLLPLPDIMMNTAEAVINGPCRAFKDLQKDFLRRMMEANQMKKALRSRKRWLTAYTKLQTILYICKNMAERSLNFQMEPMTFVDIGDSCTTCIDYGAGRSIDADSFKRQTGIALSSTVMTILQMPPHERTMVQQEQARRECQKVEVFSEFPISIQEKTISKAFYQEIGPKRVIVRQGHFPQYFYFVVSGEAYIKEREYKETGEVTSKACGFVKKGMSFGGYALITNGERASTVISRTPMQLLYLHGNDYLDIFVYPKKTSEKLPEHISFISTMNFMENFPINLMLEKQQTCTLHHFRRNAIVTHDSRYCRNLFIIKYGYCKVFRKIDYKDEQDEKRAIRRKVTLKMTQSGVLEKVGHAHETTTYIERDSGHVTYFETQTPKGTRVRVPVTKLPRTMDKLQSVPLQLPRRDLVFLPLALVKEGEIFGFDQTPLCPRKNASRATILVSLDAEVVAVDKEFFCHNCSKEAKEIIERTFIYDDDFIERRMRQRCNRDVHLEEVLSHYFYRLKGGASGGLHQTGARTMPTVHIVNVDDQ